MAEHYAADVDGIPERLSVEAAIDVLSQARESRLICLGADGFWLSDNDVRPSLDHILDLSSVTGRGPETNASLAMSVIETWPDDPTIFAVELVMVSDAHPCPCCGHMTFDEPPGCYGICPVCFWEDDAVQLRWPTYAGGANKPSLIESQQNFVRMGAVEERFIKSVRRPSLVEAPDEGWRLIDLRIDSFEDPQASERDWPVDLAELYWWRSSFWRRSTPP